LAKVTDPLIRFIGQRVRLAAHHLPSDPIDPMRWGGGSCGYQPGPCPVGHHLDPTRMYSFAGEGILDRDGSEWVLLRFDGAVVRVGLSALAGHRGRIVAAPLIDVDAMRDQVVSAGIDADVGIRVDELRSVLDRLRRST